MNNTEVNLFPQKANKPKVCMALEVKGPQTPILVLEYTHLTIANIWIKPFSSLIVSLTSAAVCSYQIHGIVSSALMIVFEKNN